MARYWRVAANFTRIGDVVVTVVSPNWPSAIRKAALEIKRLPVMKGRRLNAASFMLAEVEAPVPAEQQPSEQLSLADHRSQAVVVGEERQPDTTSEPEK